MYVNGSKTLFGFIQLIRFKLVFFKIIYKSRRTPLLIRDERIFLCTLILYNVGTINALGLYN